MKRFLFFAVFLLPLVVAAPARADTFVFRLSSTADLGDLPHTAYFVSGINWQLPRHDVIVGATLWYRGLYDSQDSSTDHLFTHLFDTVVDPDPTSGPHYSPVSTSPDTPDRAYSRILWKGTDADSLADQFAGQGVLLGDYNSAQSSQKVNLALPVAQENLAWLADGNFGFGIDPDCHWFNEGVEFVIETASIPEPASVLVLGTAFGLATALRRRRRS